MDQSPFTSVPVKAAQLAIRVYQLLTRGILPPRCRFAPSCSDYCSDALGAHGLVKGLALGLWRLLKCHPFHPGGYDPVLR